MEKVETTKMRISFREVLASSRPFWWINTAAACAAGFAVSGGVWRNGLVAVLFFTFPFNLYMYGVNDIYDYESDIRNPRKGGIDGAILAKAKHPSLWAWIALVNLPFWVWLLLSGPVPARIWFVVMMIVAALYSVPVLRFKERPVIDSFTSSFHYTSPIVYGLLLGGSRQLFVPAVVTYFLWVAGNHAFGAVQDIVPDREADIKSIATVLGAPVTLAFTLVLYVSAIIMAVSAYGRLGVVAAALLSLYVINLALTWADRNNPSAAVFKIGWRNFLTLNFYAGFWLTQLLLVTLNPFHLSAMTLSVTRPTLAVVGALSYLIMVWWIWRRLKTASDRHA